MTHSNFKRDEEYGYQISLKDDRPFLEGHQIGFTKDDTEVTAIQKILDAYIDTSTPDAIAEFPSYKMEFSINVLDSFCIALVKKIDKMTKELDEIKMQEEDIQHLMTKPYLTGQTISPNEKIEIYNRHEKIVVNRRNIKDAIVALQVVLENTEKARNFILGMNRRIYSAKSAKYRDDPSFRIEPRVMRDIP